MSKDSLTDSTLIYSDPFLCTGHQRAANNLLHPGGHQPGNDRLPSAGCRKHQWLCSAGGNKRAHKGRTRQAADWYHPYPAPPTGKNVCRAIQILKKGKKLHEKFNNQLINLLVDFVGVWLDAWWGLVPAADLWHHQGHQSPLLRDELPVPGHHSTTTRTLGAQPDPGDAHHCFHSHWGLTEHTHTRTLRKLFLSNR